MVRVSVARLLPLRNLRRDRMMFRGWAAAFLMVCASSGVFMSAQRCSVCRKMRWAAMVYSLRILGEKEAIICPLLL